MNNIKGEVKPVKMMKKASYLVKKKKVLTYLPVLLLALCSFSLGVVLLGLYKQEQHLSPDKMFIKSPINHFNPRFSAPSPGVDIVIAVHDALTELKDMLASVNAFTPSPYQIHLVNDRSNTITVSWLEEYRALHSDIVNVYHLVEPEIGYTFAINLGITKGHNPYVVIINTDVIVTDDWLGNMITCMQHTPQIGLVGPLSNAATYQSVPVIRNYEDWSINQLPSGWMPNGVSRAVSHLSDRIYPKVPFLSGFCMLVKRMVFDTVGLFDTENFPLGYGEENDMVMRAQAAGFLAVIDDATYVFHHKTRSFTETERRTQSKDGRQKLLHKHSEVAVKIAEAEFNHIATVSLKNIREHLYYALQFPELFHGSLLRILFLLPSSRAGGGSTSVVREAQEMKRIGITVRIALWDKSIPSFLLAYPEDPDLFIPWPKTLQSDADHKAMKKLRWYGILFDIVIATVWLSVEELLEMAQISSTFLPAYYIQDYEPDFFPVKRHVFKPNIEHIRASQSYKLVNDMGGVMYAKSAWLANKVFITHGSKVHIVPGAIEDLECQHLETRTQFNSSAVRIVAMLRPSTARRNAEFTYQTLRAAKLALGSELEVITFGCRLVDAPFMANPDFEFSHRGVLDRIAMSRLYTETDVFLDLSIWQAYGRSAAEAMTCGNTAIITQIGGAAEFVRHGYNGFLVDATNQAEVLSVIRNLVKSKEYLKLMQQRARDVREQLRLQPAVLARLQLFINKLKERNPHRNYQPWEQLFRASGK